MFLKIVTLFHIVVCEQVGMSDIIHDNGKTSNTDQGVLGYWSGVERWWMEP